METTAWCGPDDLSGACQDEELAPDVVTTAIDLSSTILFWLTGSKWPGTRTDTVRPLTSHGCGCWAWLNHSDPSQRNRDRQRARNCHDVRQLELGGYPVTAITTVKIDGEVVPADRYRIDDRRYLTAVRATADQDRLWWPACQALDLPDTEPGTMSVVYEWGAVRPESGRPVAGALACELALALSPDTEDSPGCRLPKAWTSLTRAGITITRSAVDQLAESGLTGLPEVDLWLTAQGLASRRQGAAIIDPAKFRRVRRTGS